MIGATPIGAPWLLFLQTNDYQNNGGLWALPGGREDNRPPNNVALGVFLRARTHTVRAGADTPQADRAAASNPTYVLFDARAPKYILLSVIHGFVSVTLPIDFSAVSIPNAVRDAAHRVFGNNEAEAALKRIQTVLFANRHPVGVAPVRGPPTLSSLHGRNVSDWNSPDAPPGSLLPRPRWLIRSVETTRNGDDAQTTAWLDDWPTA